jgi:hypothetical protein
MRQGCASHSHFANPLHQGSSTLDLHVEAHSGWAQSAPDFPPSPQQDSAHHLHLMQRDSCCPLPVPQAGSTHFFAVENPPTLDSSIGFVPSFGFLAVAAAAAAEESALTVDSCISPEYSFYRPSRSAVPSVEGKFAAVHLPG